MATFEVRTNVPYAVISYGNRFSTFKKTANLHGIARFEWSDFAVYVNAQKAGHVFSDRILSRLPAEHSWGQTSEWYLVSRFNPTKELYGLHRLDVPAEKLLEDTEAARRKAEEEARKLREAAEKEARKRAEEVAKRAEKESREQREAAENEARRRAEEEARRLRELTRIKAIGTVRIMLKTMDCWNNIWTPAAGKWWACRGTSAQNVVKVCMRDTPGLRCPGGECRSVKPSPKPATEFTGGYKLQAIRTGGSGLETWGEVVIIPPSIIIPEVGIPKIEIPKVGIPVPTISKTLIIRELPSSVFKSDVRTIVGMVDVDGLPVTGEPVLMKVDGKVVGETVTSNGIFTFEYTFDKAGSRKFVFESPTTDIYPDYGRAVGRVSVSSVPLKLEERLRAEREEYAARREALRRKRIIIPEEYEYKPIFRREKLVTPKPEIGPEIEPEIPFGEPEPPIPTRGSIQVDLPIPPVAGLPIEVPVAVWLDDMFRGNAPTTIDNVKVGSHTVVLKMTGFVSPPMDVEVREGEVTRVSGIEMIIR